METMINFAYELLRQQMILLEKENAMLREENERLKKELSKPERMTPSENMTYWGIFG